MTETNVS